LVCDSRDDGFLLGQGVIDGFGLNPSANESRGLDDGDHLGPRHEVSLGLLNSLSRRVSLGRCLGVDIGLGHRLSGSESVLHNLGLINNLGRHPDLGCGDNFHRGIDLSLRLKLCVSFKLNLGLVHRDGGWHSLCVCHCCEMGNGIMVSLGNRLDVVMAVLLLHDVVNNHGFITTKALGVVPRLGLAGTV